MVKSKRRRTIWADASAGEPALHFGATTCSLQDYGYALHESELTAISATDLQHALRELVPYDHAVLVTPLRRQVVEDVIESSGVDFCLLDGTLAMKVFTAMDYVDDDHVLQERVSRLLADFLRRHRLTLVRVAHDLTYVGESACPTDVTLRPQLRGRNLDELFQLGVSLAALVDAATGGSLTRRPTLDLLRAGQAQALLGQPESGWLDAKSRLYDIGRLRGKVSLAQAVARFANSDGGLVVLGMGTRVARSGEVIASIEPVSGDGTTLRRHRQALENHLYPLPVGLEIELVPAADGELLVIHVPPQPDGMKPFLVHGAIVDGKGEGAFISIVRRHGEDSIPITAAAVHTAMSMNRIIDRLTANGDGKSA